MKKLMNMTTTHFDLPRYSSNADLKQALRKFDLDGLELMAGGTDERGIVAADDVVGVHLKYFHHWVSIWNGDVPTALAEYRDWDAVQEVFGGRDQQAIVATFQENIAFLNRYHPEYAVMHVSDVTIESCITRQHVCTDEEVITAQIELANQVFSDPGWGVTLLFENLFWSGLTMERPELVDRLLQSVDYPNCGVMLDVGHLLHTNLALRSLDEGIDYIYQVLSRYDNLDFIKGVHLHQSLSGEYAKSVIDRPFTVSGDYQTRALAVLGHVLKVDSHQPFVSDRIPALIDYINPEYLVFELITSSREEHERLLAEQISCFNTSPS
ncbi:MAG: sugar phosphate isomerase/epimerase [Actinomycetia bacterium]|nr:sugar phosphate isomerase/epimerase [Actinomycetes bacterium]